MFCLKIPLTRSIYVAKQIESTKSIYTQGNLFVSEEDIKDFFSFRSETLVAVRAPHGTTLEVPDPDDSMEIPNKRYRIFLKSKGGPVEVFLVSLHDNVSGQSSKEVHFKKSP